MLRFNLSKDTKVLFGVLLISLALRVFLIHSGGQFFWPDEKRYNKSRAAVEYAISDNFKGVAWSLGRPDHFLFKVMGVIPAGLEKIFSPDPRIPATFFCFFSIFNIWLLWRIVIQIGSREEALLTALLFAFSNTFFYYSRHLLPYDLAITFGFLSILSGLKKFPGQRSSLWCGFFASLTFLTYNGYWVLAAFSLLFHTLSERISAPSRLVRLVISGMAFITPILAIILVSAYFGENMLEGYISFSRSVIYGRFEEGWSLPVEYFWYAEHGILVVWVVSLLYCLWRVIIGLESKSVMFGISGVFFVFGVLVVFSVVLHKFVVYGRLARLCVPFFCILAACSIEQLRNACGANGKLALIAVGVAILLQAGANMYVPLSQVFPENFLRESRRIQNASPTDRYDVLYAEFFYPGPKLVPLRPHKILLKTPHPLQYLPYQYEGYTPNERNQLRQTDFGMRLIRYLEQ